MSKLAKRVGHCHLKKSFNNWVGERCCRFYCKKCTGICSTLDYSKVQVALGLFRTQKIKIKGHSIAPASNGTKIASNGTKIGTIMPHLPV